MSKKAGNDGSARAGRLPVNGDKIKAFRKLKCITQEELAAATDVSLDTISRMENSNSHYHSTIASVAKYMGVRVDSLLMLERCPPPLVDLIPEIVEVIYRVKGDRQTFDSDASLDAFIAGVKAVARMIYPNAVIRIEFGSVRIVVLMADVDVWAVIQAFLRGDLTKCGVESFSFPNTGALHFLGLDKHVSAESPPVPAHMVFAEVALGLSVNPTAIPLPLQPFVLAFKAIKWFSSKGSRTFIKRDQLNMFTIFDQNAVDGLAANNQEQ